MLVRDGLVEAVGGGAAPAADEVVDLGGAVVTPGLVNTHHHLYQTLTRARAQEATLFEWLRELYPVWAQIDAESEYAAARTGLAELALSGCTTVFDHHYVFPRGRPGSGRPRCRRRRSSACGSSPRAGRWTSAVSDGGLPPDSLVESIDEILADTERLAGLQDDGGMVQLAVAPCSPFSVTKELMRESAELARRLGLRLHTHLAETVEEDEYCQRALRLHARSSTWRSSAGSPATSGARTACTSRRRTSPRSGAPASASRTARRPTCGSVRGSRR